MSSSTSNVAASSSSVASGGTAATSSSGPILLVHEIQRGNPVLQHVKNVRYQFTKDIIPDYVMQSACALFLSVRYHFRHPKHILRRIDEVGRNFRLRVLLVLVDDEDNQAALTELNKIAFATNFTMIQAWSNQECARYLETFKAYENKSSSSIQAREETEFMPRLQKVMTTVRSVNKTDVTTLMDVFGSFSGICAADEAQLMLCPGIGGKKLKRLLQVLHEPFEGQKKSRSDITSDKAHQGIGSSSSHEKPLDPAKKYEVEGWTNSRTDIVNALREGDSERDTRDEAAASMPVEPPVELAEEDEEAVDPEELNDTIVFGYE